MFCSLSDICGELFQNPPYPLYLPLPLPPRLAFLSLFLGLVMASFLTPFNQTTKIELAIASCSGGFVFACYAVVCIWLVHSERNTKDDATVKRRVFIYSLLTCISMLNSTTLLPLPLSSLFPANYSYSKDDSILHSHSQRSLFQTTA